MAISIVQQMHLNMCVYLRERLNKRKRNQCEGKYTVTCSVCFSVLLNKLT
jgi:hypothetical protein